MGQAGAERGSRIVGLALTGFSLVMYSMSVWAAFSERIVASVVIGLFASIVLVAGVDLLQRG